MGVAGTFFSSFLHMMVLSCSAPLFFFFFLALQSTTALKKGYELKSLVLFCGVTLLPTSVAGLASD
jgi:hypothetical protein